MDVEYVDADEFEALEALLHSAERRLGEYSNANRNSCWQHAEHAVLASAVCSPKQQQLITNIKPF